MKENNHTKGVIHKLISLTLSVVLGLLFMSKALQPVSLLYKAIVVTASATIVLLPWMLILKQGRPSLRNLLLSFGRAFLLLLGVWIFFTSSYFMPYTPITTTQFNTALQLTPVFITILAVVLFYEKLNKDFLIALLICLGGHFIIFPPDIKSLTGMTLVFIGMISLVFSCSEILCKKQTETDQSISQAFYFTLFLTILLALQTLTLINRSPAEIDLILQQVQLNRALFYLISIGVLYAFYVISLFKSYKYAPAVLLMPFSYIKIPLGIFIGSILLNLNSNPKEWLVSGLILMVLSYIFYQTKRKTTA